MFVFKSNHKIWGIRIYLPREGTETFFYNLLNFYKMIQYKNLSTSRGAGNLFVSGLVSSAIGYKNLSTSREAGNLKTLTIIVSPRLKYIYLSTLRGAGNA